MPLNMYTRTSLGGGGVRAQPEHQRTTFLCASVAKDVEVSSIQDLCGGNRYFYHQP